MCGVFLSLHAFFVRLYDQHNHSQRNYHPIEKFSDPTKRALTEAKAHRSIISRSGNFCAGPLENSGNETFRIAQNSKNHQDLSTAVVK